MTGEVVTIFVLLVGIAILGAFAWRLTLHLIGIEPEELALAIDRFRDRRAPEPAGVPMPAAAIPAGVAERVDRVLARLDDRHSD